MPELPEVETIANSLRPAVAGRAIHSVEVLWARTLATHEHAPGAFAARLCQQAIQDTRRRGKYLLLLLTVDTLIIHLRMSGDVWIAPVSAPAEKHQRLRIGLKDGQQLVFNDPRKFGRAWLVADPQTVLGELGPEPLDESLTAAAFHQRLQATRRQIKPLLLDQHFIAGLGNIYTDEALHLARLHPRQPAHAISAAQAATLLDSIRAVLGEGIRRNGASIDWVYRGGDFQNHFRAYQRTGQPCPVCGAPIQRLVVGQRGTHICPICQEMWV